MTNYSYFYRSDDTARSEIEVAEIGAETPPPLNPRKNAIPSIPGIFSTLFENLGFIFLDISGVIGGPGALFRPIREEPIAVPVLPPVVPPSPTASLTPSLWNVTGRGGAKSDYRRRTLEYVDNNANTVNDGEFKSSGDDRLVHLMDKLHIDNGKNNNERPATTSSNHISAAAVAPALLLANHISAPLPPSEKLAMTNGDAKTEASSTRIYLRRYS